MLGEVCLQNLVSSSDLDNSARADKWVSFTPSWSCDHEEQVCWLTIVIRSQPPCLICKQDCCFFDSFVFTVGHSNSITQTSWSLCFTVHDSSFKVQNLSPHHCQRAIGPSHWSRPLYLLLEGQTTSRFYLKRLDFHIFYLYFFISFFYIVSCCQIIWEGGRCSQATPHLKASMTHLPVQASQWSLLRNLQHQPNSSLDPWLVLRSNSAWTDEESTITAMK